MTAREALRLAEASDWKGLQRLVERQPELARARGEFGMLPLHWACSDARAPLALLLRLLAAHPGGARARNAAELLPLHIAIRAGAHEAWLARLIKAFPGAVRARLPSGETAVEQAEALRLDAARLKLLYRAEQALTPERDGDLDEDDEEDQEELEAEDDVADGELSDKRRAAETQAAWPGALLAGGSRLSAATELSDAELVSSGSASDSSPSEGAVRLSASRLSASHSRSRDLMVSPSSVSSNGGVYTPPSSTRRSENRRTFPVDERLASTSLGGRHRSLPSIPSLDTTRRRSVGALALAFEPDGGPGSASDDSDVDAAPGYYLPSMDHQQQQLQHQQTQRLRTYQTQPQGAGQRQHSPFAYRRASHGEATLAPRRGALEAPPAWRLDDACAVCQAAFSMFKHRHHCRNCGRSICRQHSADKKVSMAAKGFATPQRVCVSCYALLAQSRALQRDLALSALAGDPILGAVAFQQQHYNAPGSAPGSSGGGGATALRSTAVSTARRSSMRGSLVSGSSPGEGGPPTTASLAGTDAGYELALAAQVRELRALAGAQQQRIEQLAQSNAQLQHRLLEHEEDRAETTLLVTQLMTRVSVLELAHGHHEDDEEDDSEEERSSR